MTNSKADINTHFTIDPAKAQLNLTGQWVTGETNTINLPHALQPYQDIKRWTLDGSSLTGLDSVGAYGLDRAIQALKQAGKEVALANFRPAHLTLMDLVSVTPEQLFPPPLGKAYANFYAFVGEEVIRKLNEVVLYIAFVGELVASLVQVAKSPFTKIPWRSIAYTIEDTGYRALPIVGLLNFLIGVVLAYQTGLQLETYGANIFIVDISTTAILREFGPLIAAIILAGRTASSYTAQIGMMVVNEEVDALRTLGLWPMERLVLPKLLGAIIALPLLTLWSDVFGVFGSMVMSKGMLDINYYDFLNRIQQKIELKTFLLGLSKAPVFAVIIASVGCFQGMRVSSSAASVGHNTTKSVVQAIFLIIVVDAGFSILFSAMGL